MTPEVLAQAREPFFTTRSGRRGLGLSLTVGLLRRHGGELSLISTPGQGTTARLRLLGINSEM
jgi:signal transduction histidine kinase